jgi:hypothetical protein
MPGEGLPRGTRVSKLVIRLRLFAELTCLVALGVFLYLATTDLAAQWRDELIIATLCAFFAWILVGVCHGAWEFGLFARGLIKSLHRLAKYLRPARPR